MVNDDNYLEKLEMNSPELNRRFLLNSALLFFFQVVFCIIVMSSDVKKMNGKGD